MTISVGRIVHYRLHKEEADKTMQRRDDAKRNIDKMRTERPGFQAHVGNPVYEGIIVPMIVVSVTNTDPVRVNGQAFFDGNDSLWVLSAKEGIEPGTWFWPPKL